MTISPLLPIPLMAVICIVMIVLKRKGAWNFIRQIIISILIFAINLRPALPTDTVTVISNDVDVLFVVDNTISMLAEDYGSDDGRRIDAVREDVAAIMEDFAGARFALISFGDNPVYMVPYTTSTDAIVQAVNSLEGETKNYAGGTSLNTAYDMMRDVLESNGNDEDDDDDDKDKDGPAVPETDRVQVVIFISDGEITSNDRLRSYERIAELIDTGAVLGYGTTSGGQMHVRDYALDDQLELLQYYDSNYNLVTALSKIDESNLKKLAGDMGVEYYHMTDHSDVEDVTGAINGMIERGDFAQTEKEGEGSIEIYWAFAAGLAVFMLYDLFYYRKKMGNER